MPKTVIYCFYHMTEMRDIMPRPQKMRHICCMPKNSAFLPEMRCTEKPVTISIDEYEVIRLIDLEGCTQEECAAQMHVSRSTIQNIYESARRKAADALVNGKQLRISGGDYTLCRHYECRRCGNGCRRRCHKDEIQLKQTEASK